MTATSLFSGGWRDPDILLLVFGVILFGAGIVRLREGQTSREPSRPGLGLVGSFLALVGFAFTAAPFVFLALGQYRFVAISVVGILIGPYFAFLGYIMLWGALFGSDAPYAREIGKIVGRVAKTLTREL